MNAVLIGCSRRKASTAVAIPALDLYQGNLIPELRARIGAHPEYRSHIFIISGAHGVLGADDAVAPYDHLLTLDEVIRMQDQAQRTLDYRLFRDGKVDELLVIAEPNYFAMVSHILTRRDRPVIHWLANPKIQWAEASSILDRWGWPE